MDNLFRRLAACTPVVERIVRHLEANRSEKAALKDKLNLALVSPEWKVAVLSEERHLYCLADCDSMLICDCELVVFIKTGMVYLYERCPLCNGMIFSLDLY